jgi:hypothetical protein
MNVEGHRNAHCCARLRLTDNRGRDLDGIFTRLRLARRRGDST